MPRLGLGLGLSRGSQLKTFAQLVKSAGGVLYLDARKADGSGPLTGNDSPFVDLTKIGNDGTLTNFAGTASSGWQALPNVLRFDGVDDFVQFADTASLDITNAPLAIGCTFKKTVAKAMYAFCRNLDSFGSIQYSMYFFNSPDVISFTTMGNRYAEIDMTAYNNTYVNVLFYWDGVNVTGYVNTTQQTQQVFAGPLVSQPNNQFGARSASIDGVSKLFFLNADICTATIYTGSDINKILNAEAKISVEYLALNP